jgi:hypothetical protein
LGLIIAEADTSLLQYSDGTNWNPLAIGSDTGWQDMASVGYVAGTNITLVSGQVRLRYGVVSFYCSLTSTVTYAAGDVGNFVALTAPAAYIPATVVGGFNGAASGPGLTAYINTAGSILITAFGTGVTTPNTFGITGTYLL